MMIPDSSLLCVALTKPRSRLAETLKLEKPSFCIYEYSKAFGTREIRWGDGSGQTLTDEDHNDLVLLPECDERVVATLFD